MKALLASEDTIGLHGRLVQLQSESTCRQCFNALSREVFDLREQDSFKHHHCNHLNYILTNLS